jgi:hypothetical protein
MLYKGRYLTVDISTVLSLSHQAENEYLAFLNEIQKLEVLEYPTKACGDLLSELHTQASKNLDAIKQIRKSLLTSDPSINIKLCRDDILTERRKLFEILTSFIDWINNAQTQKVPWSFIPSVEQLSKKIIPKHIPVLYCENIYNYCIRWHRELTGELDRYSFISLPRLHRTNILMHTLIGHELFHPCCKEFTDKRENKVAENIVNQCDTNLQQFIPDDLFKEERLEQISETLQIAWKRAVHELLCDIACAELFGPAALLAMRALASFSELKTKPTRVNNFYPPMQYRLEVVWQHVIKEALGKLCPIGTEENKIIQSFKDEVEAFGKNLEPIENSESDKNLELSEGFKFVCSDPFSKIAYIEVNKLIPEACDHVKSNLESISRWTDEKVLKQIPELVNRLQNGIPPNEIPNISFDEVEKSGSYSPEPAELPAILIAGWMYQIYREKNGAEEEADKELLSYDTLSRLLLKACEDSEMIRCNKTGGTA